MSKQQCWRCKHEFEPESSPFWPNIKEACPLCVLLILPYAINARIVPDKLLEDVTKASEILEAEAIIRERSGR